MCAGWLVERYGDERWYWYSVVMSSWHGRGIWVHDRDLHYLQRLHKKFHCTSILIKTDKTSPRYAGFTRSNLEAVINCMGYHPF